MDDLHSLLKTLRHDADKHRRGSAYRQLAQMRDADAVDPLIAALADEKPDVRFYAVLLLGSLADSRAVRPLIEALKDDHAAVRVKVAEELGWLGDDRAVDPLIRMLGDPLTRMRYTCAQALGKLDDRRAIGPLTAALRDESNTVRSAAAIALGDLGFPDEAAQQALVLTLQGRASLDAKGSFWAMMGWHHDQHAGQPPAKPSRDPDASVRSSAAYALGKIRDRRITRFLIQALEDRAYIVRWFAANALRNIGTPDALAAVDQWEQDQL